MKYISFDLLQAYAIPLEQEQELERENQAKVL